MESGRNTNYWPGFVDALTNVVIAMIFVIVVLAIALSFSVQLIAKRMANEMMANNAAQNASSAPASSELNKAEQIDVVGDNKPVATASQLAVKQSDKLLQFRFAETANTLDPAAIEKLKQFVADNAAKKAALSIEIVAAGPSMQLSENQRNAFVRVMAVRNQLMQQGFSANQIHTRIDVNKELDKPVVNVIFGSK